LGLLTFIDPDIRYMTASTPWSTHKNTFMIDLAFSLGNWSAGSVSMTR